MGTFVQSFGASVIMLLLVTDQIHAGLATPQTHATPVSSGEATLPSVRGLQSRTPGETNCIQGSPFNPDAETKMTRMEFWYGVESTDNSTEYLRPLERSIYETSISSVSWCYQYGGGRRVEEDGRSYFEDRHGRRLGIMTINSGPNDLAFDNMTCPQELKNPDDSCSVVKGQITLISYATDDLAMSLDAIRLGIKESMDNDVLLSPLIPTVVRVVYYGASENDVYPGIARGAAGGGDGASFVPVLLVGIIGAAIVALMLLFVQRRRNVVTERQLESGLAVAAADEEESESQDGDPEGSFHQGYYHYTRDGVRYLSPYCQTCIETERQLALGHGLETISEDEEFLEGRTKRLVAANSRDLGGLHSGMDVHACTSATCQQCASQKQDDLNFVSWRNHKDGSAEATPSPDALDTISESSTPTLRSPRGRTERSAEV